VSASQDDHEVVYLRELWKDFGHPQKRSTEIWEDNVSCIMMSKNPTNRDRSKHVDVKVHHLSEHMWGTRVPFQRSVVRLRLR
jgi:hypothetical protein